MDFPVWLLVIGAGAVVVVGVMVSVYNKLLKTRFGMDYEPYQEPQPDYFKTVDPVPEVKAEPVAEVKAEPVVETEVKAKPKTPRKPRAAKSVSESKPKKSKKS